MGQSLSVLLYSKPDTKMPHAGSPGIGRRFAYVLVLLFTSAGALPAAAQRCAGTYAATALHPLPQPTIVGLDIRDQSPENLRLGRRFMQGARDGGAKIDGTPTAMISINYSLLGLGVGLDARNDGGRDYEDFGGMAGGISRSAPRETRMRLRPPVHPHAPVTLALRAEVVKPGTTQILWVLSLQCQMTEQEPNMLAYDVGRVVGEALGHTVPRRAF